jgi:hypothetical protein
MITTTEPTTAEAPAAERRPGPPLGSRNAMRHGLRSSGLPKGCAKIERAINHFRRAVEDAVLDARGEVSLVDASYINSAYRWERHAQLAGRWLLLHGDTMSDGDRLSYSREVARASQQRDVAIAALNLPKRPDADFWSTIQGKRSC